MDFKVWIEKTRTDILAFLKLMEFHRWFIVILVIVLWQTCDSRTQSWLSTLLTAVFGLIAIFATVSSDNAFRNLDVLSKTTQININSIHTTSKEIQQLSEKIRIDVLRMKDETYIPLMNFSELFAKELSLLKQAKKEIWYVGFLASLGTPHLGNKIFRDGYDKLELSKLKIDSTFLPPSVDQACGEFYESIKEKIQSLDKSYVIVYSEEGLNSFLNVLEEKDKEHYTKEGSNERAVLLKEEEEFKDIVYKDRQKRKIKEENKLIPLHFLITQLNTYSETREPKYGCVAYIVNQKRVGELDAIEGHYTEDSKLIDAYKEIIQLLLKA